ncbi:MAG: hypothetical protein AMXMBFR84_09420 [Candidatus Hydrogenedentota bacterium]
MAESKSERIAKSVFFWGLWVLAAWVFTAHSVVVEPASITFTAPNQTHIITISSGGQPVGAGHIKPTVYVGPNDYNEMFTFSKADGTLSVSSIDYTQAGVFDLIIDTNDGQGRVQIYAPLSDVPDVLQTMAKAEGTTVEAVRERLGMSESLRGHAEIGLPPVMYEGQLLTLTMPVKQGNKPVWEVNGTPLQTDSATLNHVFKEPGSYVVTYREKAGTEVVATASAATQVVPYPAIPWEVPTRAELTFPTIPGYSIVTWTLDGNPVEGPSATRKYVLTKGTHTLECLARNPDSDAFRRITYAITVKGP